MTYALRPYQQAAIQGIYDYFANATGNPVVCIPTAGGKSLVMASFVEGVLKAYPDQRILIVTHVRELIEQNHAELKRLWPEAPAGIYSAGLKRRDIGARILFAGIQSIHKRVYDVQQCDLVLIDEAHLIPRASNTMYRRFLAELGRLNPLMKVIGFTATPYRLDSGLLHEGEDAIFTDIAFEVSVRELIDAGYLAPVRSRPTVMRLDVTGVASRGGEFIARDLARAVDQGAITEAAVEEMLSAGADRRSWLVFCSGVDHALHVRDALRARGITAESITGATPALERDAHIARFRSGGLRALTNANVLTTGFNAPGVDLIAMLRPTKSAGLYVQIVGRGCRLSPATGKRDCLVLDFAGNIARHGPIDAVTPRAPGRAEGEAPTRICPSCQSEVHASVRECPVCGNGFPPPETQLHAVASALPVLSSGPTEWVPVSAVRYAPHQKPGKPPSMRVDYQCGLATHREWVCFEHAGYAGEAAARWWRRRAPAAPVPRSVREALAATEALRTPTEIALRPAGRYVEVVGARF